MLHLQAAREHSSGGGPTRGDTRTPAPDTTDRYRITLSGEISVRDLRADRFTAHLSGHTGRILMLGFTGHEDHLVSAAADGTVRLWSLSEQRQISEVRVDASLHCAAYDGVKDQVLVGSAAGVVALTIRN